MKGKSMYRNLKSSKKEALKYLKDKFGIIHRKCDREADFCITIEELDLLQNNNIKELLEKRLQKWSDEHEIDYKLLVQYLIVKVKCDKKKNEITFNFTIVDVE